MALSRGHRMVPHTADVILEAWGPDLASCCEEAVAAVVSTYVADDRAAVVDSCPVHVMPASHESLLLDVLDEVILDLDTSGGVPLRAEVRPADDGGLDVTLALADRAAVEGTGAVPKAVSRSGLLVEETPDAVRCRFLVDL